MKKKQLVHKRITLKGVWIICQCILIFSGCGQLKMKRYREEVTRLGMQEAVEQIFAYVIAKNNQMEIHEFLENLEFPEYLKVTLDVINLPRLLDASFVTELEKRSADFPENLRVLHSAYHKTGEQYALVEGLDRRTRRQLMRLLAFGDYQFNNQLVQWAVATNVQNGNDVTDFGKWDYYYPVYYKPDLEIRMNFASQTPVDGNLTVYRGDRFISFFGGVIKIKKDVRIYEIRKAQGDVDIAVRIYIDA